jgi:hypothetical protein
MILGATTTYLHSNSRFERGLKRSLGLVALSDSWRINLRMLSRYENESQLSSLSGCWSDCVALRP